jgi:exodeoxyribonuclease V alpha subunit
VSGPGALVPLLPRGLAAAVAERLRPLRESGVLESVDVHAVVELGALVGEDDPDVLLGLALAVRAPRFGHICVDLSSLRAESLLPEPGDEPALPPAIPELPVDRAGWLERIRQSPLVAGPDTPDQARPFVLDAGLLYTDRYYRYQERLALQLSARMTQFLAPRSPALLRQGLDVLLGASAAARVDRQKLGAALALLRGFGIISGGPGTGKTYAVRSVLTLLWAQWALDQEPGDSQAGPRVALAAPTGKAAMRMQQSVLAGLDSFLELAAAALPEPRSIDELARFLKALAPSTIHRLLGWDPANPTRFRHHAANPLLFDMVVVDEASMVDLALMSKLADAVAPEARLVLLGDQHQLASVEAGTVLADLCGGASSARSRLSRGFAEQLAELAGLGDIFEHADIVDAPGPYDAIVQLVENRRFAPESGIGRFARACLADEFDAEQARVILTSPERYSDVALLGHARAGALSEPTRQAIVAGYRPYLERLLGGPRDGETLEALHARVLERFRVLCAHRQGRLGVAGLNQAALELLERARDEAGSRGSPLSGLSPREPYWVGRPILVTSNDYVVRLFNGDVGIVVSDAQGERKVAFPDPAGVRYVAPSRLPEHQSVFAMTIHKSQGSEFDHAMVILPEHDSPVLTRELVYTAVTRARRQLTLVGDPAVLVQALGKTVRRASGLEQKLWGKG